MESKNKSKKVFQQTTSYCIQTRLRSSRISELEVDKNLNVSNIVFKKKKGKSDSLPQSQPFCVINSSSSKTKKKKLPLDILTLLANTTEMENSKRKNGSCPAKIQLSKIQSNTRKNGSLKRKRQVINAVNTMNEGYEDDIFESKQFNCLESVMQNMDDDTDISSISTPKCLIVTPGFRKKPPLFRDCISSDELFKARKDAEEYIFRRNKKRKIDSGELNETFLNGATSSVTKNSIEMLEKKKFDFCEAMDSIQNIIEKQSQDNNEEDSDNDF